MGEKKEPTWSYPPNDEKPVKTWTAAQIREMLDEMMDTDTDDDPFRVPIAYIRTFFANKLGIDMHGRTVRVYDDE